MAVSANTFLAEARRFIGDPYVFGAAGPTSFDCSGLVQYALSRAGLRNVPRTSEEQWAWVQHIPATQLQPGDLIFEQWPGDQAAPGHVVIWLGNGKIEQAPQSGQLVQTDSFSPAAVSRAGGRVVGYGRIPGISYSGAAGLPAGVGPGAASPSGGGGGSGGGPAGASQAQLTSFLSAPSGVLSEAGALLHGTAVILDRAFGLFAPGQGWRIVFGATAAASGYGSYRAFHTGGDDDQGNLPLAVLLLGVSAVALFMMARPWPQTSAGPIKPGAYVVDVLEGQPPPAGPAAFSADEVHLTEAGLAAILAVWAAGKAGQALGGLAAGAAAGAGIFGKLWGWVKGLGSEAGSGVPGETPPLPPVEIPPVV